MNIFKVFSALYSMNLLMDKEAWWWDNAGSFEVVLGAILTQNTSYASVRKSLDSMKNAGILESVDDAPLDSMKNWRNVNHLANIAQDVLSSHIIGMHNQKASRIIMFCQNILDNFSDFEGLREGLSREWLLAQKGLGRESSDSILNYMCFQDVLVVDKYTYRFLCAHGVEISEYDELQSYLERAILDELDAILPFYKHFVEVKKYPKAFVFARIHAKIVEYMKTQKKEVGLLC